jgi:hypothetical protein
MGHSRLVACAQFADREGMRDCHQLDSSTRRVPEAVVPPALFLNELRLRGFRFERWNFRA